MNIYQTSMENLHIGNKSQQDGPNLESSSYLNKGVGGGLMTCEFIHEEVSILF